MSRAHHICLCLVPFPLRRLLTRAFRFIFLVILMVTVLINILFIIDTRARLQQQQLQLQQRQTSSENDNSHFLPFSDNDHQPGGRHTIKVEVVSSHTRVMATIDGTIILDDSEEGRNRGIHVLVLNQNSGAIMARRHFDTYSPHEDEAMSLFLSMISEERLLIFAIKDEGTFQLKRAARELLARMGSRRAETLGWRDMWAMAVQKRLLGRRQSSSGLLGEAYSKAADFNSWASPAILHVDIELAPDNEDDLCQWSSSSNGDHKSGGAQTSSQQARPGLFGGFFGRLFGGGGESPVEPLTPTSATTVSKIEIEDHQGEDSLSKSIFLADDEETRTRRRHFCSRIEGYGSVCSCSDPLPIRFAAHFDPLAAISQVPIAIIASNRPHYLYRMLRTLLSTSGCNPAMVTVFIDGYYEEPLEIAKLFGLRGVQHTPLGARNGRISQHYKASLTATFNLYPDAEYVIVLEEDLDVSPDFFRYFAQTMHLLEEDESLLCISAWNDQAYEHTSSDSSLLYRVETMPGLGWMMRRKLYKEELEGRWPTPDKQWDWDMWMRLADVRKGRECVVPDVSRTYHFGASGLNMNTVFQDLYFKKHAFNMDPSARLANVNSLKRENYERLLTKLIRLAVLVDHSKSPCDGAFLKQARNASSSSGSSNGNHLSEHQLAANSNSLFLVFMRMSNEHDYSTWLPMAKCLHVWDLDARGLHRGLVRLHLNGAHLIIIGTPYSPYSVFKPPHIVPISLAPAGATAAAAAATKVVIRH